MQNFEQIRSHIQGKYKLTAREPYLLCVELSLDKGKRHQSIFLTEMDGEDARKYLRVSTVIAPMTGIDARRMGKGDKMLVPNTAPMSAIPPQKRITPAGRYVSRLAIDSHGKELLVIDYDASLSLHPVVKGTPLEHRAQRLASTTSEDNRISFGCINVPPAFYANVVSPALTNTRGIVYILPETSPAGQLFGFQYDNPVAPATTATVAAPAAAPAAPAVPAVPAVQQVSTALGAEAVQAAAIPGAK